MARWLTSLFLLAVMAGSVLAGTPLHAGGHECRMPWMRDGMDCCAKARSGANTREAAAARLCCAFNCQSPGATTPTASILCVPPPAAAVQHPAAPRRTLVIPATGIRFASAREHPQHSPPQYIRLLALLI